MNTTNTQKRWLSLESKHDQSLIKMSLMDNGDWEYDRLGIGKTDTGWFLVDVDDTGESKRVINMCKKGLSLSKILKIGVVCKVFEKIDWGYDEDDTHRWNIDCDEVNMSKFYKRVLVNEEFE